MPNVIFQTLIAALLSASALSAWAQTQSESAVPLNRLHHINQAEILLGQIALSRSSSEEVKNFAQKMIDDHSSADGQVKRLATDENVELITFQPADYEEVMTDQLKAATGAPFDRIYSADMKAGHKEALFYLTGLEANSRDARLKNLARTLEPTVREHLGLATRMVADLSRHPTKSAE